MAWRNDTRLAPIALGVAAIAAAAIAGASLRSRAAADAGERGMAAHANLRYDEAISDYRLASARNPADWRWTYYRALVHMERGEASDAADALRSVTAARPDLAIAWWRLGEAEFKQARFDQADAAYARAEADPSVAEHARRGRARVARQQAPQAPTYAPPRDPMVDALADLSRSSVFLIRQAAAIELTRDPARREALVRRALETNAGDPDVVYEVGALLQQLRRPAEALPYFQRHLEMVEDDQQTLVQIGKCYGDLGRLREAEAALRQALALGDDAVGSYNLGVVLEERGQTGEAERHYRRAVALGAGLAGARNNLGALLARDGRRDEAVLLLREAIRLDPSSPDSYTNLSALLLDRGDVAEAARTAALAIEADPRHADAHVNLGVAAARLGDLAAARRHFEDALRVDPRHPAARANLEAVISSGSPASSARR